MIERRAEVEELEAVVTDPVCGAAVLVSNAATVSWPHAGRTWHFCGSGCRARFAELAARALLAEAFRAGRLLTPRARARWGVA